MDMRKDIVVIGILVLVLVAGAVFFGDYSGSKGPTSVAGHKIGETQSFDGVEVTPTALIEDSRCAEGVQCVWAGTVRVNVEIISGLGTANEIMELNKPITTEAEEITLVSVTPAPKQGVSLSPEDYFFDFDVKKRPMTDTNPGISPSTPTDISGGCFVGGCSSHICSDDPNVVSTCEYREAYACYRTASCERQQDGQCGWTETEELKMCLSNAEQSDFEVIY